MNLQEAIKRYGIINRVRYGKADPNAVMGRVVAEFPEAKKDIKNLISEVKAITNEVNAMPFERIRSMEIKRTKSYRKSGITLPGNPSRVRMRFAPNPNGPATIGSARGILVNSELAKRYKGKFIIRFDDTDPKTKKPLLEAYDWYLEDCQWLNSKPDEVYYASDRIERYYEFAESLMRMGKAYVCFCSQEEFKKLKDEGRECPHRGNSPGENLKHWKEMLDGKYRDGESVLRIKTDIGHKDPALRDWVAFRIIREEHPRTGRKYIVWPMLDFESAIEDHLLSVTHIVRGKDLIDSERRQRFIYRYLDWDYPVTLHWGRIKVEEFGRLSTSEIRKGIVGGRYTGWDDPALPTLMALKRRGISPEAIKRFILSLGINENDISISMENLFAENRKIMDPEANRYFFVPDPIKMTVMGAPQVKVKMPLHPGFRERGYREYILNPDKGIISISIPGEDARKFNEGDEIRLMSLFNVRIRRKEKRIIADYLPRKNLNVPKIQWTKDSIPAEILFPERIFSGICETSCMNIGVGEVIQFERIGFCRLENKSDRLVFCFGHR